MADRHFFVGQRSLSLALVASAVSFLSGCTLPAARSASPKLTLPETMSAQQQKSHTDTIEVKTLVAQRNLAYKQFVDALVQKEAVQRLNAPLPIEFQGKTLSQIKLDDNTKLVAQGVPAKPIALTFDDGPWGKSTTQILSILKKNNVKATFFVVGRQVQQYPQLVKQVVAEGHAIGNHTWSHQYHRFSPPEASREIDRTAELVYKLTGVKTSLFRPPGGILNNGLVSYAQEKKYAVIMWSADSLDWRNHNSKTVLDRALKESKSGGIVLMHDGGGDRSKTAQALPKLIAQLRQRGYKFVTVPELLEMEDKQLIARQG
ncbi:MAG TPA: polysaccharide deacetylase family protein [Waterburya sp.]